MKILLCSSIVLVNFLFGAYCYSKEHFEDSIIDLSSIVKEFVAIIDIMLSDKNTYNEDVDLNITQLIIKYGYPVQEHHVETDDGYILRMFRIPGKGPVVFLMHGLLMSADEWVVAGPNNSLAYLLATAGYDVWMGNARGNKHSRQHVSISPENPKSWSFSYDKIGYKDLPAMIDYVLYTTNKSKLVYIGHSQGTTCFFVMCSEKPEYNEKVSTMIALAPIAWLSHVKSPLARMVAPFIRYAPIIVKIFNIYEIFPKPIKYKYANTTICEVGNGIICSTVVFLFCGFDYEQLNKFNIPVFFGHLPSGSSVYQFIHYLQNIESGSFRKYDYGEHKNREVYGSSEPPKYAVDKIKTPVSLIYGDNDWLSDVEDVKTLKSNLSNVTVYYHVPFQKFNHMDYFWSKNAKRLVHDTILQLLR